MKKKVLIYGSSGVIGSAICEQIQENYDLTCVDVLSPKNSLQGKYVDFETVSANYQQFYEDNDFFAVIHAQQYKPEGFLETTFHNTEENLLRDVLEVNLVNTFLSLKSYIDRKLKKKSAGRIIIFGSTYGIISSNPQLYDGTEMGNPAPYTVSKFALSGLVKYLASYYTSENILTNLIAPHGIENNQSDVFKGNFSKRSPAGRLSSPLEVVPAVEFLLDEKNTYCSGLTLSIDGGWTAC